MGRRILAAGFAIIWIASWADHTLGAGQVDVDQTHSFGIDATGINHFLDGPVVPEAEETPIYVELAQARSKAGAVKLLVRTNFYPFIDPDQSDGGVLVKVMQKAFEHAGYEPLLDYSGWEADGTHFKRVNILYPHDRNKDAEYLFSAPIVNFVVHAYRRRDSEFSVGNVADLAGRRVCSNQAFLAQTIVALGNSAEIDAIEGDLVSCFQGLLDREHDIVLLEWGMGELNADEAAVEPWLAASDDVIDLGSLYAVIPRFSPYSTVIMHDLNESLAKMRQSGELEELLKEDKTRRSAFVSDSPIPWSEHTSPLEVENPATDNSGSRAPKGATM